MTGVRLSASALEAIERWADSQVDKPNKAEAIRRLVDLGLASAQPLKAPSKKAAVKASSMAGEAIDQLSDPSAPAEEREQRKRRLIKGPSEFREMRGHSSKTKR